MEKIKGTITLYEQVLKQIKLLILNGDYKKGDFLPSEKEIMDMTGVSRITVREALKILNETGIIQTQKGKGSMITVDGDELLKYSSERATYIKNFKDSTKARLFFEPEIAKYIAETATDEEIEILFESLKKTNSNFHTSLIKFVKNPFLDDFLSHLMEMESDKTLVNIISPSDQKNVAKELHRQHTAILNAIKEKNPELAYSAMKEHLLFVYKSYSEYFKIQN